MSRPFRLPAQTVRLPGAAIRSAPGYVVPPLRGEEEFLTTSGTRMKRTFTALLVTITVATASVAQPPAMPKPTELVLEDQFDRKADLADLRGQVVILVYGDRKANDLCKTVGESLHVCWHPEAKGQPPAKAQAAPVVPLEGLKPGQTSPNVVVVPVACCGKVPGAVQKPIRSQIAKAVPDSVVWLDFVGHSQGHVRPDRGRTERGGLRYRRPNADETQRHARPSRDGQADEGRAGTSL